jgi:hypothetical protein
MTRILRALPFAALMWLHPHPWIMDAWAQESCDALLLTGLDASSSVGAGGMAMELDGMAKALTSPQVLQSMTSGPYGCVAFAVYLWADGNYPVLVEWRRIATPEDAAAVAQVIAAATSRAMEEVTSSRNVGTLTDISGAVEEAGRLLAVSPIAAPRHVVNIVGDGEDNVGADATAARATLLARGITINGVVFGPSETLQQHYRATVTGGPSSFVLRVSGSDDFAAVWRAKFRLDISMVTR